MYKITFLISSILVLFFTNAQSFVENKNQIINQKGQLNDEVLFLYSDEKGLNFQIKKTGFSYDLYQHINKSINFNRIDVFFENANLNSKIIASNIQPTTLNYYKSGLNAIYSSNIKQYKTITYQNIYHQIDFIFSINPQTNQLKYDIILKPGSNINDIKLRYKGIDSYQLLKNGSISIKTTNNILTEHIPLSYYKNNKNQPEPVEFKILEQSDKSFLLGFESPNKINSQKTFIIDPIPEYEWGKYIGDSLISTTNGVITDRFNNVYICGSTQSLTNIATSGAYQTSISDSINDAYLTKYNKFGGVIWSTYFGGQNNDIANDVYADTSLNIFLTGYTFSPSGITDSLGHQDSLFGESDAFIAKFSETGNLVWSSYLGGDSTDVGTKLSTDFNGNVYLSGHTNSPNNIYNNGFQSTLNGENDGFIAKFDSLGVLVWSSYIGGSNDDRSTSVAFGDTSVYISGYSYSADFPLTTNAFQNSINGVKDGFISKVSKDGNLLWSTFFGGENLDNVQNVKVFNNNIYFVGSTTSNSSISNIPAFQPNKKDSTDAFVGKLDNSGNLIWSSYFGGNNHDYGVDLFFELDSNLYVIGTTFSPDLPFIDTVNSYQKTLNGLSDVFITKISKEGQNLWSTYYGGDSLEQANSIGVYGNSAIYVVGNTFSDTNLISVYQTSTLNNFNSQKEGFLTKFKLGKPTTCSGINCNGGNSGGAITTCPNQQILLTTLGGDLGTDANWIWYENQCGDVNSIVGTGDSIYVSPSVSTTYFVRAESITNTTECVSVEITVLPSIPVQILSDSIACQGQDFELTSNYQNGTVNWFGPNNYTSTNYVGLLSNVNANNAGIYTITTLDSLGCSYTDSLILEVVSSPSISIDSTNISCFGYNDGQVILTTDSIQNYQIQWSTMVDSNVIILPGFDTLFNVSAGLYYYSVTNSFGCALTDSIILNQPTTILLDTIITPTACLDSTGTILLVLDSTITNYSVFWSPTNQSGLLATNLNYGWHEVDIVLENKCVEHHSFLISNINKLTVEIDSSSNSLCENTSTGYASSTAYFGQPPYTYSWNNNSYSGNAISNLAMGMYVVTVLDSDGCIAMDSVFIESANPFNITTQIENSLCSENTGIISVNIEHDSIPFSTTFSNGEQNVMQIDSLAPGNYTLFLIDSIGCEHEEVYVINFYNDLAINISPSDTTINAGSTITLNVNSNYLGSSLFYNWTPQLNLSCSSCQSTEVSLINNQTYMVVATDSLGCTDTAFTNINIVMPCVEVFIPTMFSPNNDGLNDEWKIIGTCIKDINIEVFNQWGELIFYTNDQTQSWNGNYKGKPVPIDQYTYKVSVVYSDGNTETFSGYVNVVK
jgi:gliding motility-associated-like protein